MLQSLNGHIGAGRMETALGEVSAEVGESHTEANRLMEMQRRTRRIWKEAKINGLQ